MTVPQFVDVSEWQGSIDFAAYAAWARQWDGIARMAIKATEGTGFVDPNFATNRAKALAAGIDEIYYYHFARPDLNSPMDEANFMQSAVGAIRPQDMIILDYEVNSPLATGAWALAWLVEFGPVYGKLPGIYASSAYIQQRLQWPGLNAFPLWLANWQFTPDERPPVPPPWTSYEFVQYTDKATIPGIPGTVDANIFLGKEETPMSQVPTGWSDDGTILKSPDGTPVMLGFREHILNSNWDPTNVPLEPEQHELILEQSNPSLGAGQRQRFRWVTLEYTPKMGVFEAWTGPELLWYEQQYKQLLAKVADLQQQINVLTQPASTLQQINSALAQASTSLAQVGTAIAEAAKLSQVQ